MGILDVFRAGDQAKHVHAYADGVQAALKHAVDPSTIPYASPFSSSSHLQRIVFDDIFGRGLPDNTRSGAMRLPALARARNLLVSQGAKVPLRALARDAVLPVQPSWITSADGGVSPQHRLLWTIDDLIFYGWSLWARRNAADSDGGYPLGMRRVNQADWSVNGDNRVEINGIVQADTDVVLIPGIHEGILTYGVDAIRDAATLYGNVRTRLNSPIPPIDLHQTKGDALTKTEREDLIATWVRARRDPENGGVGYSNEYIEVKTLDASGDELMIEARNAAALELARVVGVHGAMIDATTPKASLNYETTSGRNLEFVELDLGAYLDPIAWRLSLDDVCPRTQRIAADYTAQIGPFAATGPVQED